MHIILEEGSVKRITGAVPVTRTEIVKAIAMSEETTAGFKEDLADFDKCFATLPPEVQAKAKEAEAKAEAEEAAGKALAEPKVTVNGSAVEGESTVVATAPEPAGEAVPIEAPVETVKPPEETKTMEEPTPEPTDTPNITIQ